MNYYLRILIIFYIFSFQLVSAQENNYLVPIRSYLYNSNVLVNGSKVFEIYDRILSNKLFVTRGNIGRFVILPSFKPETSLAIYESIDDEVLRKYDGVYQSIPESEKNYFFTLTKASKNIWFSLSNPDEIKITRIDLKVNYQLALAIRDGWKEMLIHTKYSKTPNSVLDSTTFQFNVDWFGGEIKAPLYGLPAEMVELSSKLVEITENQKKLNDLEIKTLIKNFNDFKHKCERL